MNVLALTIFVGSILVSLFALLWFLQAIDPGTSSDRQALLPLDEDQASSRPSTKTTLS